MPWADPPKKTRSFEEFKRAWPMFFKKA